MDLHNTSRPRATSEAAPPHLSPRDAEGRTGRTTGDAGEGGEETAAGGSPFALPRRAATYMDRDDTLSPRRPVRVSTSRNLEAEELGAGLRRRSTAISRRSARPSSIANRSRLNNGTIGLAGPEDTPAVRTANENYVNPVYADLNPSYEQPANARPVWSLAKPLPRVVRPGMVPTKSEIQEVLQTPPRPAENIQKAGIDADPTDLEEGRVQLSITKPSVVQAQLKDSRAQREANLITNSLQRRGTILSGALSTRPTRASSTASAGRRARATSQVSRPPMTPTQEETEQEGGLDGDMSEKVEGHDHTAVPIERVPTARSHQQPPPRDELEPIPEYREPPSGRASHETTGSQLTIQVDDDLENYTDMVDAAHDLKLTDDNPPLYDEIHNNHTHWSVVRTHHREFFAELLGVFVQLTIGFCADTSATLNGNSANVNTTAWAWGFSTMVAIYIAGGISGAHFNPVITIMFWFYRGFPKRKMIPYFAAQFLGAFIAAFTAYGLYYASIRAYEVDHDPVNILNGFVTSQRYDYIDAATAFFNEFMGVAFLVCAVLALGDDQNAPPGAGMNSLIIGLLITLLNFSFAYQSGAALNPSRDFGPRLAMYALGYGSHLFTNPFWFYGPWAGTLCGAFVGAALYDICIFTGGESPINYPWSRTKRSYKKSKAKWGRRMQKLNPRKSSKENDEEAGAAR